MQTHAFDNFPSNDLSLLLGIMTSRSRFYRSRISFFCACSHGNKRCGYGVLLIICRL